MICAVCGQDVLRSESADAMFWAAPDGVWCVAHKPCLHPFDEAADVVLAELRELAQGDTELNL